MLRDVTHCAGMHSHEVYVEHPFVTHQFQKPLLEIGVAQPCTGGVGTIAQYIAIALVYYREIDCEHGSQIIL